MTRSFTYLSVAVVLIPLVLSGCQPSTPDTSRLFTQTTLEELCLYVDSKEYAQAVTWDEHVAICYALAQDRAPEGWELLALSLLRDEMHMQRSHVLAAALQNDDAEVTWDACAQFIKSNDKKDFVATPAIKATVKRVKEADTSLDDLFLQDSMLLLAQPKVQVEKTYVPDETYSVYYGDLHNHSELSWDATGDPDEAFAQARFDGGLDFMALTDHGLYLSLFPWQHKWHRLVTAAEMANAPGDFVAFYGFEYSNPILGHINVISPTRHTNLLARFGIFSFYHWMLEHPEAIGIYNHPGWADPFGIEFYRYMRYDRAVPQMLGMEVWNGNDGFDEYFYKGSWNPEITFFDLANQKGWHIGPTGGSDSHRQQWGIMNDFRVAVQAKMLTREALMEAFRHRRFYSTEDKDLELDVRCEGHPMGSELDSATPVFEVTVNDGSGDTFALAELYRNGILIDTEPLGLKEKPLAEAETVILEDDAPILPAYYYVIVTQTDDNDLNGRNDQAIAAPIWIEGLG